MKSRNLRTSFGLRFLDISLVITGILEFLVLAAVIFVLYCINTGHKDLYALWIKAIVVFLISLQAIIAILFINIFIILDRTLSPLKRMEKTLEEILTGNLSLRLKIRKKDLLWPLVNKINQLVDKIAQNSQNHTQN